MLNKNKPHDIVYGVPGVGYVQNGISYKPNGDPVEVIRLTRDIYSEKI